MKKEELKLRIWIAIILAVILILVVIFLPLIVHAESSSQNDFYIKFSFQVDNINAVVETKDQFGLRLSAIELVAPPILRDSRFCIPVRTLESFGLSIKWDATQKMITFYSPNKIQIQYWIGKTVYIINGVKKYMDIAPFILNDNDRAYIPLRFFAEALGVEEIIWIPETKSVILAWPLGLD